VYKGHVVLTTSSCDVVCYVNIGLLEYLDILQCKIKACHLIFFSKSIYIRFVPNEVLKFFSKNDFNIACAEHLDLKYSFVAKKLSLVHNVVL
jgi:hypothetical protein